PSRRSSDLVGRGRSILSELHLRWIRRSAVGDGTRLIHPIALTNTATDARNALARKLRTERRGAAKDRLQTREIVILYRRIPGQFQNDGRHNVRQRHAIFLNHRQELFEVESRHYYDRRAEVQS